MLAIFYIVITPLQDTRGVPEVGRGSLTNGDPWSDMILSGARTRPRRLTSGFRPRPRTR
jgi:hypothetical protein